GTQMPVSWMDQNGKTTVLRAEPSDWSHPRFSPAGNKLAMTIGVGPTSDVWVYEWAKDTLTKLTFGSGMDFAPVWTPDGRRIAYASARDEKMMTTTNVFWKRWDGTGAAQRLTDSRHTQVPYSFHPSGKYLAFTERRPETGGDIMLLPLEGDENSGWKAGTPTVFAGTPATENAPAFSPDGRWIAYIHTETARSDIYVRPFAGGEGQWKISTDAGGVHPVWSRAGRELFYVVPGGQNIIMAAEYEVEGESFRAGRPRRWSPGVLVPIRGSRPYDVHRDGQRIAMLKPPETMQQQAKPVFVFNFTEELGQIAPAR
ncbi:MAG: hypothetical protein LC753_15485, partial [Acidobacteria bacterium]|nr:hypothetical protein [Acidobacteriota bacterium]